MTSLISAKKLSHVALKVQNIEKQTDFYRDMVGLEHQATDDSGRVYLRSGQDHHALVLVPSEEIGMHHHALEMGSAEALEAAIESLQKAGIPLLEIESNELGQPSACQLLDPEGFVVELVGGMTQIDKPLTPKAVSPRRYGHLTLRVTDLQPMVEFYKDILGLRISDWLGDRFCWLRCTPEHHGIAMSIHERAPMMHHIAFHVRDMAELIQQAEHLMRNGRILLYGPGRHGPGQNLFIYFEDEEGTIVEFAADMQRIWDEEHYVPKVWDPESRWSNMWGPPSLPRFRE